MAKRKERAGKGSAASRARSLGRALKRVFLTCVAFVFAVTLLVAGTNFATVLTTRDDVVVVSELADYDADAVVVLGAQVLPDGTPSDILKDRLETAVAIYQAGDARAIIVSGDNRDSHYNESAAMKAYCIELGVPSEDIYEDRAGYSTYESMYRACHVFGCDRIIVATQAYHLYRSLYAAEGLGMEAKGVASDQGAYDNQDFYSAREAIARTKDFIQVLFQVPVSTADEHVSLTVSGDLV